MGKSKGARIVITLECACKNSLNHNKRKPGIFRYTSTKNRRNTSHRLELRKFCPNCNTHNIFKEIK
uniref:Large ribosomal subunit protein bL33c n=1 Tax=Schizymenia dubyi TaxID=38368 RepID=A0A1C9C962_9FLOR|nr:ribosomal protein L33 [Schizymenia dubyi]AOM64918.1 ribosomal protein L33 [Schizymenia dubyi]